MGLRLLVLVFICLHLRLPLRLLSGVLLKGMGMLVWSVAVLLCRSLDRYRLFSVLNCVVPFLPCRPIGLAIWVLITYMLPGLLGVLPDRDCMVEPLLLDKDGIWLLLFST